MKITSTDHAEHLRSLQNSGDANKLKEDLGFSRLLEEKSQAAPATAENATGASVANMMNNSGLVGMIMANKGVSEVRNTPQQQLESTLDKLDQYASALGDSSKTLKDIEPLAEDMRKAAGQLSETSSKLSDDDPMKGLTNEAAVLATVEAMKFKRGDYV
ncbi:hypothetical protein C4J81_03300 [Deltaproteobacteria bacterium Smac51]|nr:hypothetical protein C4J81_03300 [Deltaproteobacteria bacterium Smac51]